jgi:MerR family transcriptional regulator, light-induced transcriptional regulator
MSTRPTLRIGELSRRTGVSAELLRAWERRYGLLRPSRSSGGLRLYTADDVRRVGLMQENLRAGLAAAEAAAQAVAALSTREAAAAWDPARFRAELAAALENFDEPRAHAIVDRLLAVATVDAFVRDVILPYLYELGERWQRGEATVGEEHFATGVLRGRLLGLSRGWGNGIGPLALLACAPQEQHDVGLIAFGLALDGRGWRIAYLGPDTPISTLREAADRLEPALVVVSATTSTRLDEAADELRSLADRHRLAFGGGAARAYAERTGFGLALPEDPVAAADFLADETPALQR